jgi:hypothetical protein
MTIVGGVVSTIVMIWLQLDGLPEASVAVQVRVITPVLPQAAAKLSLLVMMAVPQLSLPVAVPVLAGSVSSLHSTVTSAGQVTVGGVLSTNVIVAGQSSLSPFTSVMVSVTICGVPTSSQPNVFGKTLRLAKPQSAVLPLLTSAGVMVAVLPTSTAVKAWQLATGAAQQGLSSSATVKLQVVVAVFIN